MDLHKWERLWRVYLWHLAASGRLNRLQLHRATVWEYMYLQKYPLLPKVSALYRNALSVLTFTQCLRLQAFKNQTSDLLFGRIDHFLFALQIILIILSLEFAILFKILWCFVFLSHTSLHYFLSVDPSNFLINVMCNIMDISLNLNKSYTLICTWDWILYTCHFSYISTCNSLRSNITIGCIWILVFFWDICLCIFYIFILPLLDK